MADRDNLTYLAAQTYAQRGWAVAPAHGIDPQTGWCTCGNETDGKNAGKHPRTSHGHLDATTDLERIAAWFDPNRPGYLANSNILIATGSVSGLVIIDIDPRHSGEESLNDLELDASMAGADLTTRSVITGSSGTHLFYAYPSIESTIPSRNGLLQGIDIKADGGYVIAPPSVHLSGRIYTWTDTTTPIEPLPDFLLGQILSGPGTGGTGAPLVHGADLGAILRGEARIPLGSRDNIFFALASRLRGANVPQSEAAEIIGRIWDNQTDQDPSDPYPAEEAIKKLAMAYAKFEPNPVPDIPEGLMNWARNFNADRSPSDSADGDSPESSHRPYLAAGGLWEGYEGAIDTHRANGRRLAFRFQRNLRCLHHSRDTTWYRCEDGLWVHDHTAPLMFAINSLEPTIRREALLASDDEGEPDASGKTVSPKKKLQGWAHASASPTADRLAAQAAAQIGLITVRGKSPGDYFDADADQIAFPNGVVDLRTGEFRALTPEDLVSRTCKFEYDARLAGQCPRWFEFLARVLPDPAVQDYVRLMLGMSLLGADKNHEFFILDGSGANGKSTLLGVVTDVLGNYAQPIPKTVFVQRRDDAHPADTATLEGLRFATNGTELAEGDKLNEDLIKSIASLEPFQTRKMHQDFWMMKPRCTLFLSTNNLPKLNETGIAMQRRIRRVRFEVTIPPPYDPLFAAKLVEEEGAAILATLVADCRRYLAVRNELVPPEAVLLDTADYLEEEDTFGVYVRECVGPAPIEDGPDAWWVPNYVLFEQYKAWCAEYGYPIKLTSARFVKAIGRFFPSGRHTVEGHGQQRCKKCKPIWWPNNGEVDPTVNL